jgi:hypothetical protein
MPSVADDARADLEKRMASMSAADRLDLALALGDDDATLYGQVHGLSIADAREVLRLHRQNGRRPSRCLHPND